MIIYFILGFVAGAGVYTIARIYYMMYKHRKELLKEELDLVENYWNIYINK